MDRWGRRQLRGRGRWNGRSAEERETSVSEERREPGAVALLRTRWTSLAARPLTLVLLLALLLFLAPMGAGAQNSALPAPSSASVWYADDASLVRVDTKSGKAAGSTTLPRGTGDVSALAVHPTNGSAAVLAGERLLGFDASGKETFRAEVPSLKSTDGQRTVLAFDPSDGGLWAGGANALVRTDARGGDQRSVAMKGEVVRAISPAQDGSAWVLGSRSLLRVSEGGEVLSEWQVTGGGGVPEATRLAVDELGGYAYAANEREIVQVRFNFDSGEWSPARKLRPEGGVEAVAVNPFDSTLYVANDGSLVSYDRSGKALKTVDLKPYKAGAVRALSFDAPSGTLWAGAQKKLLGFAADGAAKAQIGAGNLGFLASAPLALSSRLSLVEPSNGRLTKDPRQPVKLRLEAFCNNAPCPGTSGYGDKLRLEATMNGEDVSSFFQIKGDPGASGGTEVIYAPDADLDEGENALTAQAAGPSGLRSNRLQASFTVDSAAPRFLDVKPEDGTSLNEDRATITGRVDDPEARVYLEKLTELGGEVNSDDPNGFSFEVPLEDGENEFRLLAYDEADNVGEETVSLAYDSPIDLEITEPEQGAKLAEDRVTVKGTVRGPRGTKVKVGDTEATVSSDGSFVAEGVPLSHGRNEVVVAATAPNGKSVEKTLELDYEMPMELEVTEPADGATVTESPIAVRGTVEGPPGTRVSASEIEATVTDGSFEAEGVALEEGANAIAVTATAPDGRTEEQTLNVTYEADPPDTEPPVGGSEPTVRRERPPDSPVPAPDDLPPDPEAVASTLDDSVATDTAESTKFLYEGEDAVQTGVEEDTIEEQRVAILKGKVLNREGEAVPRVRVTVQDHPEYGETLTREDGAFDIVVNGGSTVTLNYEKDRYAPAQRQVEAPWRDYAVVEDVVLVGYSTRVTDVDLGPEEPGEGSNEVQAARGSEVTDEEGTRQATVLFPAGTEAEMVLPDGEERALPDMDFRATEYTVGEDGPEAMPAPLPPTSAYTYAVELSADEAVESGAQEIRFSKPVSYYVENFLDFPVGLDVPVGYHDKEKGAWVPVEDGRVIGILAENDGLAELDVDGSGEAADATALEDLGITDEERKKLAELYEAGESLWRVAVSHFSAYDLNYPGGPIDATAPNQQPPDSSGPIEDPNCTSGSIIECQNQILGEELGIAGTPFSLHYGSDRVEGYKAANTLDIALSGDTLPSGVKSIELRVSVAGQSFTKSFPAEPNQRYEFVWDGKDAYGRALTGEQEASYGIGYVYDQVYQNPANRAARSFGLAVGKPILPEVSTGREVTLWQEGKITVGAFDARGQGLGALSLDVVHQYDPEGQVLQTGSGGRRSAEDMSSTISTVAGRERQTFGGDAGPATEALLSRASDVAVDAGGAFYIADAENNRVRRVAPDGIITTVAGNGANGYGGDGGPATEAQLSNPRSVAAGPDGSIYVADSGNYRVRKVGVDGTITTVAGTGVSGTSGDGGPATEVQLGYPLGITLGPDGSLYIADSNNHSVFRVDVEGALSTVAGISPPRCGFWYRWYNGRQYYDNGRYYDGGCYWGYYGGFNGDGLPANEAHLRNPSDVAVSPEGELYIADASNHRVRKVEADGTISTVAGTGYADSSGDGGPALEATLYYLQGIAADPDGGFYVTEYYNRVRHIGSDGKIATIAGNGDYGSDGDGGPATEARLNAPAGIAGGPNGELYIADSGNELVRRVDRDGIITRVAGTRGMGDGGPAVEGRLRYPDAVTVAPDGSFYIADPDDHRIRKVGTNGTISTVAGTGNYGFSGDGGPAAEARLNYPRSVTVTPDGALYVADTDNNRIRRVGPDGTITTVAGTGEAGFSGDGGPATEAKLAEPEGVALGPDGVLYVADTDNNRIRRIGPDGTIATVAGTGESGSTGVGGPATEARLDEPKGIVVAPDGNLYIADLWNSRVLKVGTDGIVSIVAGGGGRAPEEGGPATEARLDHASGISLGPDGALYIADGHNCQILRVGTDGMMRRVAGNGTCGFSGDGNPATGAQLDYWHTGIAVGPDRDLYIADNYNNRVRKVTSTLPGIGEEEITVSSESGGDLYVFDSRGKHLRTLDATTGIELYSFSYDDQGSIAEIEDVDGLVTIVERDGSGNVTAIVAPNGERTELSLDRGGYLNSITNPAGETAKMTYDEGGLIQSLTDPKGNVTRFSYDEMGLLTKDEDPEGGYKALSRTDKEGGFEVDLSTAMGREKNYAVEDLPTGDSRRVNTNPNGLQSETLIRTDGSRKATAPDGTVTESVEGPDPRYGMQAPVPESATVTTSGRRSLTVTTDRQVKLTNPKNPSSVESITNTTGVGSRTWTSTYDAATRKTTNETPEGRQSTATVDEKGRVVLAETADFAPTSYEYDGRGRLTEATTGEGSEARTFTYAYDEKDRLQSITDPEDRETTFEYDDAGRVTKQTLPDGREVSYSYDENGNLTSLTPPGRPGHAFDYTKRNLGKSYTPPDVGEERATSYEYNLDRQPTTITRPGGEQVTFGYDAGGRKSRLTHPDGETSYSYDPDTGRLSSVASPGGTLSYSHDGFLPLSETLEGEVSGEVSREYDGEFRVTETSVNGSSSAAYSYDDDGLLTQAGDLSVSRDEERGVVTGSTLSGTTDSRSYNAFGELEGYEALHGEDQQFETSYERDALGRITEKTETVEGTTTTYSYAYDGAGRLAEVQKDGAVIASYAYDANGNRTSATDSSGTTSATYDEQDRLVRRGDASYGYTNNGELLSKTIGGETTGYEYDALGNLLSVSLPDGKQVEYVVDGRNRRVGKKVDGQLERGLLYDGQLAPVAELDGQGDVVSRFVYATKGNVPDYMVKGGKTYRIVSDHLGSPRLVVDASTGEVAQRMDYDEFGQVLYDSNPGFQPFGFAGGLYDTDTSLTRFGARDYDAEAGRWTSKDPIRFAGGDANLYGYVLGDPVNLVDQNGLWSVSFSAYYGRGGGLAFGKDPTTEKYFAIGKAGVGLGGGLSFNPQGAFPGPKGGCVCGDSTEGVDGALYGAFYANGGLSAAGPVSVGASAREGGGGYRCVGGDPRNLDPYRLSGAAPYASLIKPDTSNPDRGWGLKGGVDGGVEIGGLFP